MAHFLKRQFKVIIVGLIPNRHFKANLGKLVLDRKFNVKDSLLIPELP